VWGGAPPKKVLITGATGFVGRHTLAPLAALGYEIHAVAHSGSIEVDGVQWHRLDLVDERAMRELVQSIAPTHLVHAAWTLAPGKYLSSPDNLAWLRASLSLVEAFAAAGGRHAAITGTCFEYDWTDGVCSEETPLRPKSLYGAAKAALHLAGQAFAKQSGFTLAWARLFFLYGPHEHPARLVASVVRSLLLNEPARCSHGEQIRDFLHVQDAAGALVHLVDRGIDGAINVASGERTRLKDLIYHVAGQLHGRDRVELGAVKVPPGEAPLVVADVKRLRTELGWTPSFDLERGLAQTIAWWRTELKI
jgi:nucleoside-diphosphate-sugar epimerase